MTADGVHRVHVLMAHTEYEGDGVLGVYTDESGAKNAGLIHWNGSFIHRATNTSPVWRYEGGDLVLGSESSWLQVHEVGMDQFPKMA